MIEVLREAMAPDCVDDLEGALANLRDGTCDYLELIPTLQEIAKARFYYYDDNGAGGYPRPTGSGISFEGEALGIIENIKKNALFLGDGENARVLKSHSTQAIKRTLERLQTEGNCSDKSLVPILEKIARKDVYDTYSSHNGRQTDCQLGELAGHVIQLILSNYEKYGFVGSCSICGTIPDDITVNKGREESWPAGFDQLISVESNSKARFRRCPDCGLYFNWIDLSLTTNWEQERLVRFSNPVSRLLDKLFSDNPKVQIEPSEVECYLDLFSLDLLFYALQTRFDHAPHLIKPFVPYLVDLLIRKNDLTILNFLRSYVSDNADRAWEVLRTSPPLAGLMRYCQAVMDEKK